MRHRLPVSDDPPADRGGRHALDPAVESAQPPALAGLGHAPARTAARRGRDGADPGGVPGERGDHEADGPAIPGRRRNEPGCARWRPAPGWSTPTTRLPQVRPAAIPGPRTAPPADLAVYRTPLPRRARTLLDVLEETAARHPDAPALDAARAAHLPRRCWPRGRAAWPAMLPGLRCRRRATGSGCGCRPAPPSCTSAILAVLAAGAAYVPVDADDPDERAETIWAEADVCGVLGDGDARSRRAARPAARPWRRPTPADDAWIIFTSGSTGKPKGVAVSHRSRGGVRRRRGPAVPPDRAARPGRPGAGRAVGGLRRLLRGDVAGLAVRRLPGARPAVAGRSGRRARAVAGRARRSRSCRPCRRWPRCGRRGAARVRLLIFGGEACPPELAERLAAPAARCGTPTGPPRPPSSRAPRRSTGEGPVRIGLPLRRLAARRGRRRGQAGAPRARPASW